MTREELAVRSSRPGGCQPAGKAAHWPSPYPISHIEMTTPSRPSSGPVIGVDHVIKRFAGYVAVDDADFEVGAGEFFSLLGPSGSGKTTTLRMIAGFEQLCE